MFSHARLFRPDNDNAVLGLAGLMVLPSAVLVGLVSPRSLPLTAFVGLDTVPAGIAGLCRTAMLFGRFGLESGNTFFAATGRPARVAHSFSRVAAALIAKRTRCIIRRSRSPPRDRKSDRRGVKSLVASPDQERQA